MLQRPMVRTSRASSPARGREAPRQGGAAELWLRACAPLAVPPPPFDFLPPENSPPLHITFTFYSCAVPRLPLLLPYVAHPFDEAAPTANNNAGTMAVPAPGMLSTTEKGWLQHTPKYIFENHTQPLSGILLIYVSLVYSITSLIGHVKVKNESNNIAKAIDNAIQSFCRHRVDYRCFRESYDMFRSRYRAFLAGLRGNELDCATTMKEYHMIAFNSEFRTET